MLSSGDMVGDLGPLYLLGLAIYTNCLSKIKCITYYYEERYSQQYWRVIAHRSDSDNDVLGDYPTEIEALIEAHKHKVPVQQGMRPELYNVFVLGIKPS